MIVREFTIRRYAIPFADRLRSTDVRRAIRMGVLVEMVVEPGDEGTSRGYGDVAPLAGYSDESLDDAMVSAQTICVMLLGERLPQDYTALTRQISRLAGFEQAPASARFGAETALADAASSLAGLPLCRWLNPDAPTAVPVNALITGGHGEIEDAVGQKAGQGFSTFKLKVGGVSLDEDCRRLRALRKAAGPEAAIRLDANQRWAFDEAVEALDRLRAFDIEYVEEPLVPAEAGRWGELFDRCQIPIAVDESLRSPGVVFSDLATQGVCAAILKPTVLGGIRRCLTLADDARAAGIRPVVTSTIESGIGLTACLHLAAALGPDAPPCGLDTLHLLSDPLIKSPPHIHEGSMHIPDTPGLGLDA